MNGGCCGRGKVGEGEGVLFCDAFDTHAAVILLRCAFDVWHVCRRYRPSGVIEMTKSKRRCWYVRFVVLYCKERRRWQEQQKRSTTKKNTMTMCEDDYVQRRWIERSATSMVLTASERRTTGRRQWDVMGLNHNNQNRWIRHKIKFCWQATGGSQKYK